MDIAIIQFPGSNCERETILAVKRAGMVPVEFLWNEPIEKLIACDGYVIVGGFSYEDRSRAGILAALDPVMQALKTQSELGKPILGVCNGAQILVESGLVPGLDDYQISMALTDNKRIKQGKVLGTGYYNAWVHLILAKAHRSNVFTQRLSADSVMRVPVAHAEGRFVIPDDVLERINSNGLVVFQYCNEQGDLIDEFPVNPNGSVQNIAAIANQAGNVMAIMPHPERTTEGDALFHSMRDYIADRLFIFSSTTLSFDESLILDKPRLGSSEPLPFFVKSAAADEIIVELIITDNHALSVQNTLRKKGIDVGIQRQVHWEVACSSDTLIPQIKASHLLYNERKEFVVTPQGTKPGQQTLLVRPKDDVLGRQTLQQLNDHAAIDGVSEIQHGILWTISADPSILDEVVRRIIQMGILCNPISHECFRYA